MDIKDIVNKIGGVFNSSSFDSNSFYTNDKERMRIDSNGNTTFPNWQDVLMDNMNKRMLTIKNPERLNINNNHRSGEWVIEYMGRDLSLEEDNYRWDVYGKNGVRGYYIVERELIQESWLNVRWGLTPTNIKERKELIDKSRLKDKERIQSDMIQAINSLT